MTTESGSPGQVVLVNGPAGIGKTTTSRRLAASVPNGTCIHGDPLRDFIVTRGPDRPTGLTHLAATALIGVYLAAGFGRVLVDYISSTPQHVDRLCGVLPAGLPRPRSHHPVWHGFGTSWLVAPRLVSNRWL